MGWIGWVGKMGGMGWMGQMGWIGGWMGWMGWDPWVAWPQYHVCVCVMSSAQKIEKSRILTLEKPCGLKTWYPCAFICVLSRGIHGIYKLSLPNFIASEVSFMVSVCVYCKGLPS